MKEKREQLEKLIDEGKTAEAEEILKSLTTDQLVEIGNATNNVMLWAWISEILPEVPE